MLLNITFLLMPAIGHVVKNTLISPSFFAEVSRPLLRDIAKASKLVFKAADAFSTRNKPRTNQTPAVCNTLPSCGRGSLKIHRPLRAGTTNEQRHYVPYVCTCMLLLDHM